MAAESHDDDSADDASTSLQKIQSGPRFSQGQVLKCILPVLSEDLTQLCRVEGFDQPCSFGPRECICRYESFQTS